MERVYDFTKLENWPWSREGHHGIRMPRVFIPDFVEDTEQGYARSHTPTFDVGGVPCRIEVDFHTQDMVYGKDVATLKPASERKYTVRARLERD